MAKTETKVPELREGEDPRGHPAGTPHTFTEAGSHVATKRGYAHGAIIEEGEPVSAGIAVAEEWMAETAAAEAAE